MIRKNSLRFAFVLLAGIISFSVIRAVAASNVVPPTSLADQSSIITVNDLKPSDCSAITLTAIFYCPTDGSQCNATDASELVIGTSAGDDIRSGKGDDCILGGGGGDSIRGEQDIDVCIGGPGTDSFPGNSCDTQIQEW